MYMRLLFCLCIVVSACSHRGENKPESNIENVDNYKITLSSGGGFTGLYSGYNLHGDGRVESWQRPLGKGDSLLWQRSLDATTVERLREKLLASGALTKRYDMAGNMTAVVVYETADTTYRWSWNQSGKAPHELAAWYKEVRALCAANAP